MPDIIATIIVSWTLGEQHTACGVLGKAEYFLISDIVFGKCFRGSSAANTSKNVTSDN